MITEIESAEIYDHLARVDMYFDLLVRLFEQLIEDCTSARPRIRLAADRCFADLFLLMSSTTEARRRGVQSSSRLDVTLVAILAALSVAVLTSFSASEV